MDFKEQIKQVKLAAPKMANTTEQNRNQALQSVSTALLHNQDAIFAANQEDRRQARLDGMPEPILNRLKFDDKKLKDVLAGIQDLIKLSDPLFQTVFQRELDQGLLLKKVTCPIGVIGVIFEARPDALVQISALCIKSGNCVVLKGGSEALKTNKILFDIIYNAILESGLPLHCMMQLEARSEIRELLSCHGLVDLLIPRGSNAFVQYIMDNTKIPVMGHADGICHIYVDLDADLAKAVPIVFDAKTQYVSACNAVETLLVHKEIAPRFLPELKKMLDKKQVKIRGTKEVAKLISCKEATEEDNKTEYLDYI